VKRLAGERVDSDPRWISGGAADLLAPDGPLAAAFAGTSVGFFLASGDVIAQANPALSDLVGVPAEALIGRRLVELFHPDDRGRVAAGVAVLAAGDERRFSREVRCLRGDGSPVWVEMGVSAVETSGNGRTLLIGQVRDASDRREMELALRKTAELFRAAFDDAAVGMMLLTPQGTIERANSALYTLLGYDPDSLDGGEVLKLMHADDRAETERALHDLRDESLAYYSTERRFIRTDGEVVWAQVVIAPVRAAGELRCFVTQVIDISARRAAEEKFRMVFDASGIGISLGANGMLTETNPAYQRLIGYDAEELSGMHYSEITHPDDVELDSRAMEDLVAGRQRAFTQEKRYIRRDGHVLWVRVTVTMSPDGRFAIGLIEDISERRRLLARTVEAAESERVALAADLHDGPIQHLTATAFAIDLLVNMLSRNDVDDAAVLAAQIRRDIASEMSSLRHMMVELRPPVMDERGLEAAVSDYTTTLFSEAQTAVSVDSDLGGARLPPELETAIYRLTREALINIKRHAGARHANVTISRADQTVHLTVADDGGGFDTEHVQDGHYGLVTMRERVESLGGTIAIDSRPGATYIHAALPLPTWARPADPRLTRR
jgi:PAS domain S-box-containing protein